MIYIQNTIEAFQKGELNPTQEQVDEINNHGKLLETKLGVKYIKIEDYEETNNTG